MTEQDFTNLARIEDRSQHIGALKQRAAEQKERSAAYKAATKRLNTLDALLADWNARNAINVGDEVLIGAGRQADRQGRIVFVGPLKVTVTGTDAKGRPFIVTVGHGDVVKLGSGAPTSVEAALVESVTELEEAITGGRGGNVPMETLAPVLSKKSKKR